MSVMESRGDDLAPDMRLHEAHHRIANDLSVIASMVRLQAASVARQQRDMSPAEIRDALTDAASRIDAVGRLHRTLCYTVDGSAARDFIQGICRDASSFAAGKGTQVICHVDLRREPSPERLRALGLLIHELVLNGLKHAHPSGVAGLIDVRCDDIGGALSVDVRDDGVGFPDEFDPHTSNGFGFRMMRELAKQLDALLAFESTPLGVTCRLRSRRLD